MPRSSEDVRRRIQQAALDLYGTQGYERTTTAEIAARAGVTERTYFRHFVDKREVLFDGAATLRVILSAGMADAPLSLSPLDALLRTFLATERLLEDNRPFSEPRQRIIAATPPLQERELAKIATLTDDMAAALRRRGVDGQLAQLAAQVGMAAFAQASVAWLADPSRRLSEHLHGAFANLRALVSPAA